MIIIINLDVMLAKGKMKSNVLASLVGITEQNEDRQGQGYQAFNTGCSMSSPGMSAC